MNLLDGTPREARGRIERLVRSAGFENYRAGQVFDWLWRRPVAAWEAATNLPRSLVALLQAEAPLTRPVLRARQESRDGTVKYLWEFAHGSVESVLIPEGKRATLCISSQVGCAFGCVFCSTGTMGFGRNLAPWEITAQVREITLQGIVPTNVVFMGMGEPLHNWDAVDVALTTLNSPDGFGIGARHITVSTVGLVPGLLKLAQRPEQFRVAISLHAATSEVRGRLMPVERKYPIPALTEALAGFRRRITLEYVMIAGVNDAPADAASLARLATELAAHVNLLPLHPGSGADLKPTPLRDIERFAASLESLGTPVSVRRSRGKDIDAACGQLKLKLDRGGPEVTPAIDPVTPEVWNLPE